jgi:hypothetical protein
MKPAPGERGGVEGRPLRLAAPAVMTGTALICAALAVLVETDSWARWFHHPARQPMPDVTRQGATVWRIMLVASAAALVVATLVDLITARSTPPLVAEPQRAPSRKRLWTVACLLVIGLIPRALRIDESLWYDEIASWLSYGVDLRSPGPIIGNYFDPVNHVFHTLLSWCSVTLLVDSLGAELALRLPALLFSLMSIGAIYGLASRALSPLGAAMAGLIAALAPVSVLEGVEARGYSMMICFAALASWALLQAHERGRPEIWAAYALVCALGVWSHFVTAFVPVGHGWWIAWRGVRHREWAFARRAAVALALAALITLTLYAPMLPDMLGAKRVFFSSRGDEPTVFGAEGRHALLQLGGSWCWWAALPGLVLAAIGTASLSRTGRAKIIPVTMLGLPLMAAIVMLSGSWMYARFTFFALPGAIVLMAAGVDHLLDRRRWVGLAALALLVGAWMIDLKLRPPKQPLRDAADFVRANCESDDQTLAIGLAHQVLGVYARDLNLVYSLRLRDELEQKLAASDVEWVILEYPKSTPEAINLLVRSGFVETARFRGWVDWNNGDVIVYRRSTE